jgi:hypothetical protein
MDTQTAPQERLTLGQVNPGVYPGSGAIVNAVVRRPMDLTTESAECVEILEWSRKGLAT